MRENREMAVSKRLWKLKRASKRLQVWWRASGELVFPRHQGTDGRWLWVRCHAQTAPHTQCSTHIHHSRTVGPIDSSRHWKNF